MALLGKTLRGKTTRPACPGGIHIKRNYKPHQINKDQAEFDQFKEMAKKKRDYLRQKIKEEQKFVA